MLERPIVTPENVHELAAKYRQGMPIPKKQPPDGVYLLSVNQFAIFMACMLEAIDQSLYNPKLLKALLTVQSTLRKIKATQLVLQTNYKELHRASIVMNDELDGVVAYYLETMKQEKTND